MGTPRPRSSLPAARIDAIYRAAVDCGLAAAQDSILTALPPSYVAMLRDEGAPGERLLSRLNQMNRTGRLADGSLPLAMWLRAAALFAHPREQAAVFEEALAELDIASARGPLHVGLPGSLHAGFVGRERLLADLHAALAGGGNVALRSADATPGRVFAHGGGGIGKSRLAIEYAHQHAAAYPGGIFFAVAGERDPVAIWAELARRMVVEHPGTLEGSVERDESAAERFARWLADSSPGMRLLVLDDVHAGSVEEVVKRYRRAYAAGGFPLWPLPAGTALRVLFTTRLHEIPGASPVEVTQLGEAAAFDLLVMRAGRRPLTKADEDAARDLARNVLGGHALAISLAGAYLRAVGAGVTFAEYAREIGRAGLVQALLEAAKVGGYRVEDHEASIVATYEMSRSRLDLESPRDARAWRIMGLAAWLAPNVALDPRLIARLLAEDGDKVDAHAVGMATRRLVGLSLLSPTAEGEDTGEVVIHPPVAAYTRWVMGEEEGRRALEATVGAVNGLLPADYEQFWKVSRPGAHPEWEWLSPARVAHALEVWAGSGRLATAARWRLGRALGDTTPGIS